MRHHGKRAAALTVAAVLSTAVVFESGIAASAAPRPDGRGALAATPGQWTQLGSTLSGLVEGGTPTVWISAGGNATVLWLRDVTKASGPFTYEAAVVGPNGGLVGTPVSIFGTSYWVTLSSEPTLVSSGGSEVAVFSGTRSSKSTDPYHFGCVVGDLLTSKGWTLQPWSLSNDCAGQLAAASVTKSGVLSEAWPGSWLTGHGVLYRIGTSPTIPATGTDNHIPVSGFEAFKAGEANDIAGNDDLWVALDQTNSGSADAYFLKNVTANTPLMKIPGTGTFTANDLNVFSNLAMTDTNTHAGIWLAFFANSSTRKIQIWRAGTSAPINVPGSTNALDTAISAGPGGRLWIAWYNANVSPNTVSIVRTNEADTAFGPAETYKTPCGNGGQLGLSGGSFARLDVAAQCNTLKTNVLAEYVTQSLAPLQFSPTGPVIKNTTANNVTFKVADVGNAVSGATVSVAGRAAKTGASGTATISFPRGMKTGHYTITVSAPNYYSARGTLVVNS